MTQSRQDNWNSVPKLLVFNEKPGQDLTNMFHRYPAMMHTRMLQYLMEQFEIRDGLLLDPFCGTGRSLLAGMCHGCKVVGVDVNPLACLITSAKLTRLDPKRLSRIHRQVSSHAASRSDLPRNNPLLKFWFSRRIVTDLGILLHRLKFVLPRTGPTKAFFYTALSEVVREVSHARKNEYKLYRMTSADRRRNRPNVFSSFDAVVSRNIQGLMKAAGHLGGDRPAVYCCDWLTCDPLPVHTTSVDFIVSSPPYGDSRTTVAYGEFSRLSLTVLSYDEPFAERHGWTRDKIMSIDSCCLGGSRSLVAHSKLPEEAQRLIASIAMDSPRRSKELARFLRGYVASLNRMWGVLKTHGQIILILGNRCVAGRRVPLDAITVSAASQLGMTVIFRGRRDIPYKRLPRLVLSRDESALTKTMMREAVIVLRKQ